MLAGLDSMDFSQGKSENQVPCCYYRGKTQIVGSSSGNNLRTEFRKKLCKMTFSIVSLMQCHSSLKKKNNNFYKPQYLILTSSCWSEKVRRGQWTARTMCRGPGQGVRTGKGINMAASILNSSRPSRKKVPCRSGGPARRWTGVSPPASGSAVTTYMRRNCLSPEEESPEKSKPNNSWSTHKAENGSGTNVERPHILAVGMNEPWMKGRYGPTLTQLKSKTQKKSDWFQVTNCMSEQSPTQLKLIQYNLSSNSVNVTMSGS